MYNVTRLWPTWHRRGFYTSNAVAIAATGAVFGVAEGKNSRRKFYFFKFPSDAMHVFYYFFLIMHSPKRRIYAVCIIYRAVRRVS